MSLEPLIIDEPSVLQELLELDINAIDCIKAEIAKRKSSTPDQNVSIPLSKLKAIYLEYHNFQKAREKIISDLKAVKMDSLLNTCQQYINMPDTYYDCVFCKFKARSKKALALHLRKCTQVSLRENENQCSSLGLNPDYDLDEALETST